MGDPYTLVTSIDYILWTILVTFTLLLHYLIIKYNLLSVLIMYVPIARPGRSECPHPSPWSSAEP